jgi:isoleucyl-tRNA synthetase
MKMSKSLGNVIDPRLVMLGGKDAKKEPPYGADVLRLWVASVDYSSDVLIGGRILSQARLHCTAACGPSHHLTARSVVWQACCMPPHPGRMFTAVCLGAVNGLLPVARLQVADVYRKMRFTLRYLLGNLSDFDPAAHTVAYAKLAAADRYILARFAALVDECTAAYANYQFYK